MQQQKRKTIDVTVRSCAQLISHYDENKIVDKGMMMILCMFCVMLSCQAAHWHHEVKGAFDSLPCPAVEKLWPVASFLYYFYVRGKNCSFCCSIGDINCSLEYTLMDAGKSHSLAYPPSSPDAQPKSPPPS